MGKEGVERGLEVAKSLRPDFVVLTGDFVSHSLGKTHGVDGAHHAEPCADVLAQWKNMPMLAILGNHDHWNGADIVTGALRERGIRVLRNEATALERGGARLWMAGVDDALVQAADLPKTLGGIPPSEATVLLAHEPDFADYAANVSGGLAAVGTLAWRTGATAGNRPARTAGDGEEVSHGIESSGRDAGVHELGAGDDHAAGAVLVSAESDGVEVAERVGQNFHHRGHWGSLGNGFNHKGHGGHEGSFCKWVQWRSTPDPLRLRSGQALAALERTRGLRDGAIVKIMRIQTRAFWMTPGLG